MPGADGSDFPTLPEMHLHLVRHGEVANPNHVVYGDLPGFNLSGSGVRQAHRAAALLAEHPVAAVITSPLARAVQTATAIARKHGVIAVPDDRLVETRQFPHWTGLRWDRVVELHRVEFEAYLVDASSVTSGSETIADVARRVIEAIDASAPDSGDLVVVGHQDPTQATRLVLTGRPLSELRVEPPGHASVITLERDDEGWIEVARRHTAP